MLLVLPRQGSPQQHRQRAVPLGVVARRRVQVGGEHDAIAALVAQDLLLQAAQRGVGVREVGDLISPGPRTAA
eukprot:scaffold587_cov339-Prasinococcus_capsulatus_cf.AAC.8